MSAPAIVHTAQEQWLMRRREMVTASDVPAILGIDIYGRKAADVYAEKLGLVQTETTWPMVYGNAFQDGVGRAFEHLTARPVSMASLEVPEITVHPSITWLGATLDGKERGSDKTPAPADGEGAFEAKLATGGHVAEEGEGELPLHFQVQNTVQQACAELKWGTVAAVVSLRKPPRWADVVLDLELFDAMVPVLQEFRYRVLHRQPPTDDPTWFSSEAIKRIWATNDGRQIVLDEDGIRTAAEWREWKDKESEAKAKADGLGDLLRLKLAGAALGWLPGGCAVALSNVKETRVEAHVKAAHTRLLYKQPPKGRK